MATKAQMNQIYDKLMKMTEFDINCGETIMFADSVDQEALFEFQTMYMELLSMVAAYSGNSVKLSKKYPSVFYLE